MREAVGTLIVVLFFAGTLLLARRTENPGEELPDNIKGICMWFYRGGASCLHAIHKNWPKVVGPLVYWVAMVVLGVVCGAAGLVAVVFFGYGAVRGATMFLTLQPVEILAGLVLFLVSLFVGWWALIADVWGFVFMASVVSRFTGRES